MSQVKFEGRLLRCDWEY